MPYTITSVSDLEAVLQVVAARGINPVFAHKTQADYWTWAWTGFLPNHFPEEYRNAEALLFPEDAQRLLPEFDTNAH